MINGKIHQVRMVEGHTIMINIEGSNSEEEDAHSNKSELGIEIWSCSLKFSLEDIPEACHKGGDECQLPMTEKHAKKLKRMKRQCKIFWLLTRSVKVPTTQNQWGLVTSKIHM